MIRRFLAVLACTTLIAAVVAGQPEPSPQDAIQPPRGERRDRSRAAGRSRAPEWTEFKDDSPLPAPSKEQQQSGFVLFTRSTLERIYQHSRPRSDEVVSSVTLQAVRGEYEPVQIAVYPLRDLKHMEVRVSDLTNDAQQVIPAKNVSVRMVRFYGSGLSIKAPNRFGVVPKTLEVAVPIDVDKQQVRPFWITVHVPADQEGGTYRGAVTFAHSTGMENLTLSVEVVPIELQEPDIYYGTLSVNASARPLKPHGSETSAAAPTAGPTAGADPAALASRLMHQVDVIYADQREHGMNTISPRSGKKYREIDGHPNLPDVELAIAMYKKYKFTKPLIYIPSNLLKTNKINRSENYKKYDPTIHVPMAKRVAAYYTKRFRDEGLPGIVFVPVEEPNLKSGIGLMDPPDIRQKITHALAQAMKESGASVGLICTPQSVRCAIDYLDLWIMAYRRFTPDVYDMARQRHAKLAIYANSTVMGNGTYFTRFLFGYFVWANQLDGMLPWTYPLQPKRFPVNVAGKGEGALNITDGFLGVDDRPIPTIQWELCREGIEDASYLTTISALARRAGTSKRPEAAAAVAEAEQFLQGIRAAVQKDVRHYVFENPSTFEPAPQDGWDVAKFESLKQREIDLLKRLSAPVGSG
jgi:hypothetical protein